MPRPARRGASFEVAREIALGLPGVTEGFSYGTPAFRAGTRFLARLKEDGVTLALRMPFEERERLLGEAPLVFFLTPHYQNYPALLVRLQAISRGELRRVLELAWRHVAPKGLPKKGTGGPPGRARGSSPPAAHLPYDGRSRKGSRT